ncbi:MAG: nucleoside kinase [Sphaerochaetaceae bacterium]|nr:nucleoside kinase [Sphaerochaetaceae bacterium]MDC7248358.1 nucleoside kinase [Sphaerochaetaceae bacterium]
MKNTIKTTFNDETIEMECGITIEQCLIEHNVKIEEDYQNNPIVAAQVNYELLPLSYILTFDAIITPIYLFSDLGKRVYRHSICFLLCYASWKVFPKRQLMIGHSLGDGYYFHYTDSYILTSNDINKLSQEMERIVKSNLPITYTNITYEEGLEYFQNRGALETVDLINYQHEPVIAIYKIKNYMDKSYEPLVSHSRILSLWELRKYESQGMLLRYPRSNDFTQLQTFKDNPLLFKVYKEYKKWNQVLHFQSLGKLNMNCINNNINEYIRLAETLQQKKIAKIADDICDRPSTRIVFVAGPSSSGKTTFTNKLGIQLKLLGKCPILISLDNYYRLKEDIPRDENGKHDFECLEALDTDLFQKNVEDLFDNKEIELPSFNFKKNKREYLGNKVSFEEDTILLIEGIHGLNPKLIPTADKNTTYKIYISALTQLNLDDHNRISTTDNRILRRITRDNMTRGVSATTTLSMWASVQAGENKHIFPYQNNADTMLNSALEYELGAIKPFVEPLLKTVEPSSSMAFAIARRLLAFLSRVHPIAESMVPKDSLLREFIGGSEFNVT